MGRRHKDLHRRPTSRSWTTGGGGAPAPTQWTAIEGFTNTGTDSYLELKSQDATELQIEAEWTYVVFAKLKAQTPSVTERWFGKDDGSPGYSIANATTPRLQSRDQGTATLTRATVAADAGKTVLMLVTRKTGTSGTRDTDGAHMHIWNDATQNADLITSDTTVSAPTVSATRWVCIGNKSNINSAAEDLAFIGGVIGNQFLTTAQVQTYMEACVAALTCPSGMPGELARWEAADWAGSGADLADASGNGYTMAAVENTPGDLVLATETPVWIAP